MRSKTWLALVGVLVGPSGMSKGILMYGLTAGIAGMGSGRLLGAVDLNNFGKEQ